MLVASRPGHVLEMSMQVRGSKINQANQSKICQGSVFKMRVDSIHHSTWKMLCGLEALLRCDGAGWDERKEPSERSSSNHYFLFLTLTGSSPVLPPPQIVQTSKGELTAIIHA